MRPTAWFMGSGSFGALCLGCLHRLMPELLTRVVTGLPSRAGRGMRETPTPVEELAQALGLSAERTGPLAQNEALVRSLEEAPPSAIFVVDFGQKVPEPFLSAPRWGCLNIHPSLLPRWRGAAPIQRALMNGDREVGVTVFRLVPEMDAGPILKQVSLTPGENATATELREALGKAGAAAALQGLMDLEAGTGTLSEQDHSRATYAPKLAREEFQVSWDWEAERVHNTVRALDASGGAYVPLRGGRLKLWRTSLPAEAAQGAPGQILALGAAVVVACGAGALNLEEVQAEGKRRTRAVDWARGLRLAAGDILS